MDVKTRLAYNMALHYGIIEAPLTQFEKDFFLKHQHQERALREDLRSIQFNADTALRYEHSFDKYRPVENWKAGDTIELARITVPTNDLGILRQIDTLVLDQSTGRPISTWDNPVAWDNVFKFIIAYNDINDANLNGRLEYIPPGSLSSDRWPQLINSAPLPPLMFWDDDRYSWGNPSNKMGVVLPKGCVVRLFAFCKDDTEFRHPVLGRLVHTNQDVTSESAKWQAQRGNIW